MPELESKAEEETFKKLGGKEKIEYSHDYYQETEYPKPIKRYHLVWESPTLSIEEPYYWVLKYLNTDADFPKVEKLIDIFSAAESSAFFGASQTRLGAQQDKVSQYLATIGKMTRELFQLVRELRIIDERVDYYEKSDKGDVSSDIVLKGIWVDQVEGGGKNPASVYGLAREVQFISLPDLFFSTHILDPDKVDDLVEKTRGQFNVAVKNVLKRKLKQYLVWKKTTYGELVNRRRFTLQYLRQHFDVIKMYIDWVKPYLKYIRRLHMDVKKMGQPEIISAFESSLIEVELLAIRPFGEYNACVVAHFLFTTKPQMQFAVEGYHRGPIHIGKADIELRGYAWTDEQIKSYKQLKDREDMKLITSIDRSLETAMESLGEDLLNYLKESGEKIGLEMYKKGEKAEARPKPSLLRRMFRDFISEKPKEEKPKKGKKKKVDKAAEKKSKDSAEKYLFGQMWLCYKNFKKAHGMIQW